MIVHNGLITGLRREGLRREVFRKIISQICLDFPIIGQKGTMLISLINFKIDWAI